MKPKDHPSLLLRHFGPTCDAPSGRSRGGAGPARGLVEPTGTILEVRCDGGHVKVEHDGAAREERYYNTGKDGVYQQLVHREPGF